jgi:hypothetical protein
MSRKSLLPVPVLACLALLLGGALNRQTTSSAPSWSDPPAAQFVPLPHARPGRQDPFEAAIAALESICWLQMTVWHEKLDEGGRYSSHGQYLEGPDSRRRLQVDVTKGSNRSNLTMVSNGDHFWKALKYGKGQLKFSHQPLPQPNGTLPDAAALARAKDQFLSENGFPNLPAMLKDLRARIKDPEIDPGVWGTLRVLRLKGKLSPAEQTATAGSWELRLEHCYLFLDEQTFWPHRLEWWGSAGPGSRPVLLHQLEFRDPLINQPLSPEACDREFTYRME